MQLLSSLSFDLYTNIPIGIVIFHQIEGIINYNIVSVSIPTSFLRYNTHAKLCNSILYTKTNNATYRWLIFGTLDFYNVKSYQTMHFKMENNMFKLYFYYEN